MAIRNSEKSRNPATKTTATHTAENSDTYYKVKL